MEVCSPAFISSSLNSPWSKYFSISPSSLEAMVSTNSLCNCVAFSFSVSGIGNFCGFGYILFKNKDILTKYVNKFIILDGIKFIFRQI